MLNDLLTEMIEEGRTGAALDILYDAVDLQLRKGNFSKVNDYLMGSSGWSDEIEDIPMSLLLGILTATLPAKSKLRYRNHFFNRVKSELERRGEKEIEGLLMGLE